MTARNVEKGYRSRSFLVDEDVSAKKPLCERFVLVEASPCRMVWSFIFTILVLYVGTILPVRLCFLELHIPEALPDNELWLIIEQPIDWLFWVDLLISGFLSYRRADGKEVTDVRLTLWRYLCGDFWLNLAGCLPAEFYAWLFSGQTTTSPRATRLIRLQRLTRLLRMVRGTSRMARIMRYVMMHQTLKYLLLSKRWRTLKLLGLIFWIAHIFACIWYALAAVHDDPETTWVARRGIMDEPPGVQWLTSLYFVFTVFTTVGFGDISGSTPLETGFLILLMLVGTMLNSLIIGDVLELLTQANADGMYRHQLREHVGTLISVGQLKDKEIVADLAYWTHTSQQRELHEGSHIELLQKFMTSGVFPRAILQRLPPLLLDGKVMQNRFVSDVVRLSGHVPARLTVFVALLGVHTTFEANTDVYAVGEHAFNMYLVLSGSFSEFHFPLGLRHSPPLASWSSVSHSAPRLWSHRSYFGDVEILVPQCRRSTVRCETTGATTLALPKDKIRSLVDEFREFSGLWRNAAARKLMPRRQHVKQATDVWDFAASTIQLWFRRVSARRKRPGMLKFSALHGLDRFDDPDAAANVLLRPVSTGGQLRRLEAKVDELEKSTEHRLSCISESLQRIEAHLFKDERDRAHVAII
eukprot:TRINITY_DN18070_c0_g1_i1.p1 TRINITY_DN18070_c0_g1~~TRINITY_DN18070_c0_g1_i1.p1  ORF type:complete len:684 (+),score=120.00 TRINITY_DN18070_c0_g1_i1:135-2054(+)